MQRKLLAVTVMSILIGSVCAQQYSWQTPHATVMPSGDLQWAPLPYVFAPGPSVKYIDFAAGNDAGDGTKEQPWKHHPWDPAAVAKAKECTGIHTYVFKRGVIYRGALRVPANAAGTAENPIQLTSDPSWGAGEACIYGSEQVTGWRKGGHPRMPSGQTIYHADLNFAPRCVFMVANDGAITRLKLARTPNYTVSDPDDVLSEWWLWENPRWWANAHKTNLNGTAMHLGIDTQHLKGSEEDYLGGVVWSEWGIVMGAPYATRIEAYDPQQKAIVFQGPWNADSQQIHSNNRYSLEDLPRFLDEPGEFWFEKRGNGGRLYVRLPGDIDPSSVVIEAARHNNLIDATRADHLRISGLTFRFNNIFWELTYQGWQHPDAHCAAIRLLGAGTGIIIDHCRFEHVTQALRLEAGEQGRLDEIAVLDNNVAYTDHGGIEIRKHGPRSLGDVLVLRNRLAEIGFRPLRVNGHMALTVAFPETAEIAGNIVERCGGAGLFLFGGKGDGSSEDVPFSRMLVHHNKVVDPLLIANDWGGIETWQGGPFYVYNNVSGNPGGLMHWTFNNKKDGTPRFGHAYYLDGAFKNYHFNNIAWGKNNELGSKYANCAAFQEIISYQNTFFNNTVYKFVAASRRQAPQAGRDKFLGNIFEDVSQLVFRHSDKEGQDPNARDAGEQVAQFAYETDAYGRNVFRDITGKFGVFEAEGGDYPDLASFAAALARHNALDSGVGIMTSNALLRNAAAHDFRLHPASAAIDYGVKVFVPWSLYAVVGEWNFTRNNADPSNVIDEHWYMTSYYTGRDNYYTRPTYPLTAIRVSADDYVDGPLEDWTRGALKLDGKGQYLVLSQAELAKPFVPEARGRRDDRRRSGGDAAPPIEGAALKNPQVHLTSFLLEAYLKTKPWQSRGTIIAKMGSTAGYALELNEKGGATLTIRSGEPVSTLVDTTVLNDGGWHHVIAEVDRPGKRLTMYVDGKQTSTIESRLPLGSSLANEADLIAGKDLACTFEFLRIALGTLVDARTTIDELYTWQFNGPQFRDFCSRVPLGRRDAGALECVD